LLGAGLSGVAEQVSAGVEFQGVDVLAGVGERAGVGLASGLGGAGAEFVGLVTSVDTCGKTRQHEHSPGRNVERRAKLGIAGGQGGPEALVAEVWRVPGESVNGGRKTLY
jgi:hypothetical protein